MARGEIVTKFKVHCKGCNAMEEGYSKDASSFAQHHLWRLDWKIIEGKWFCGRCANKRYSPPRYFGTR